MKDNHFNQNSERYDSDILFSKSVKAGKRIYYIDVKQDRKGDYYISITESKRLKDNGEQKPLFEKHKIFLYREDMDKFQHALNEALSFSREKVPLNNFSADWSGPVEDVQNAENDNSELKIEIDF